MYLLATYVTSYVMHFCPKIVSLFEKLDCFILSCEKFLYILELSTLYCKDFLLVCGFAFQVIDGVFQRHVFVFDEV